MFHSRVGWCEQIASSLVVLARSVGIPARLVTGFAPGGRDALTGRFVVRERDAHAWAEIYFPGIGWQGFDPTAVGPARGRREAGRLVAGRRPPQRGPARDRRRAPRADRRRRRPQIVAAVRRRRARRRRRGVRGALHRLERAGRKAGRARAPAETPREYAVRARASGSATSGSSTVGETLDADLYSANGASGADRADADAVLTSLRP